MIVTLLRKVIFLLIIFQAVSADGDKSGSSGGKTGGSKKDSPLNKDGDKDSKSG